LAPTSNAFARAKLGVTPVLCTIQPVLDGKRHFKSPAGMGCTNQDPEITRSYLSAQTAPATATMFDCLFLITSTASFSWMNYSGAPLMCQRLSREVPSEPGITMPAAVIFAHNHPSGIPSPVRPTNNNRKSSKQALALFDIRAAGSIYYW